jgi:hypothetical protein
VAPRPRLIGITEAFERNRRLVRELDGEPEATAHRLDVAAQRREQEVAPLFELGDPWPGGCPGSPLAAPESVPSPAEILERLIFGVAPVGLGFDPRTRRSGASRVTLSFSMVPTVIS